MWRWLVSCRRSDSRMRVRVMIRCHDSGCSAEHAGERGLSLEDAAAVVVDDYLGRKARVPGIGHPFFSGSDPRVDVVIKLSPELGIAGDHTNLFIAIADELRRRRQQEVKAHLVTPEGANVSTMCDMLDGEYEARSSNLWHLIGRVPSICASVLEHIERATGCGSRGRTTGPRSGTCPPTVTQSSSAPTNGRVDRGPRPRPDQLHRRAGLRHGAR